VDDTTALTHKVAQNYLASDATQLAAQTAKSSQVTGTEDELT